MSKIIAMDLDDQKLEVAKKNGANITINSKKEDPVKANIELTDKLGSDAVIDLSMHPKPWRLICNFLEEGQD